MMRAAIERSLDRFKVRPVKVKDQTCFAVFDGRKQVTDARVYSTAIKQQRELTVQAIMEATQ